VFYLGATPPTLQRAITANGTQRQLTAAPYPTFVLDHAGAWCVGDTFGLTPGQGTVMD